MGSLLGVFGGAAGAASYYLYDGTDMSNFRMFCLCAAAASSVGFWWTGTRLDVGRLETFKRKVSDIRIRDLVFFASCFVSMYLCAKTGLEDPLDSVGRYMLNLKWSALAVAVSISISPILLPQRLHFSPPHMHMDLIPSVTKRLFRPPKSA